MVWSTPIMNNFKFPVLPSHRVSIGSELFYFISSLSLSRQQRSLTYTDPLEDSAPKTVTVHGFDQLEQILLAQDERYHYLYAKVLFCNNKSQFCCWKFEDHFPRSPCLGVSPVFLRSSTGPNSTHVEPMTHSILKIHLMRVFESAIF